MGPKEHVSVLRRLYCMYVQRLIARLEINSTFQRRKLLSQTHQKIRYTWRIEATRCLFCRTFQHHLPRIFPGPSHINPCFCYKYPLRRTKPSSSGLRHQIDDAKENGETVGTDDKTIEDKRTPPIVHAVSHEGETPKIVKKTGVNPRHPHTIKYLEKKLEDKGVYLMERHPGDGRGIERPPPKSGHGGKYTWEGPDDLADNELMAAPPAIDERDPNYVDEEEEEKILKGEESHVAGMVVGAVEVAKVAEEREGVARIEVDPHLEAN